MSDQQGPDPDTTRLMPQDTEVRQPTGKLKAYHGAPRQRSQPSARRISPSAALSYLISNRAFIPSKASSRS